MKYATETEFIKAVDRIINRKVKHYRTDWTGIDRPKFVANVAGKNQPDVLIARECGTYLLDSVAIRIVGTEARTILYYHMNKESEADFYEINYDLKQVIKRSREYLADKYHIKYETKGNRK